MRRLLVSLYLAKIVVFVSGLNLTNQINLEINNGRLNIPLVATGKASDRLTQRLETLKKGVGFIHRDGNHESDHDYIGRPKRQIERYLQAIDIVATRFDGDPIPMSPYFDCTSDEKCSLELYVEHIEKVRHTGKIPSDMSAVDVFLLVPKEKIEGAVSYAVTSQSIDEISAHSKGRVVFKPKLIKIRGSLTMKEPCNEESKLLLDSLLSFGQMDKKTAECEIHTLGPFELIAPVRVAPNTEGEDALDGEWYLEYLDNPWPIDSENYYNVRDKDIPNLVDATKVDKTIPNPSTCGQFAEDYGFKLAVYRNASCYMKNTLEKGEIFTSSGEVIGRFGLSIPYKKYSWSKREMQYWINKKLCDMIDFDGKIYFCREFSSSPGAVMMFRKQP